MRRRLLMLLPVTLLAALLVPGPVGAASGGVIHCVGSVSLPVTCASNHTTIQAGVDAAQPGDAVLIGAGTYQEAVVVPASKSDLIIRGEDRNEVVVQGDFANQAVGIQVFGPRVEVSNLTVTGFTYTGVRWADTTDYYARYLTAHNNRDYGIYAFNARRGVIEDSYASGQADAGFYIGNCNPCDAVIQRIVAEWNALGYSGTNAGGGLVIRDSYWNLNGAGILPNTLDSQSNPPQRGIVITGNLIVDSGNADAPARGSTPPALGFGIGSTGGVGNIIENNTIINSSRYGIVLTPYPETTPNLYRPSANIVRNNDVSGSGLFDLALAAPSGDWNCFSGNTHATSDPPAIETQYPCQKTGILRNSPVSGSAVSLAELAAGVVIYGDDRGDWKTAPKPPAQPTMPDPLEDLPA